MIIWLKKENKLLLYINVCDNILNWIVKKKLPCFPLSSRLRILNWYMDSGLLHSGFGFGFGRHQDLFWRNFLVTKSGIKFISPFIYSISKLKIFNIACHWAKIYFEAIFWSFYKKKLVCLQSMCKKHFWCSKSLWSCIMHNIIERISF